VGFREVIRGGIVLELDQRERVDLQLTVGVASETVEVTGAIPTLQTDSAATGHVIDSANIVNLPLLSRVAFDLVALLPGVALQPGSASIISVGDLARFNGGRASGNEIQLDGIVMRARKADRLSTIPWPTRSKNSRCSLPATRPSMDAPTVESSSRASGRDQ